MRFDHLLAHVPREFLNNRNPGKMLSDTFQTMFVSISQKDVQSSFVLAPVFGNIELTKWMRVRKKSGFVWQGTDRSHDCLNIFLEYVPGGSIASLLAKFGNIMHPVLLTCIGLRALIWFARILLDKTLHLPPTLLEWFFRQPCEQLTIVSYAVKWYILFIEVEGRITPLYLLSCQRISQLPACRIF